MSKLNAAQRNKMPDSEFAGPDRSYPVNDRAHAANAKARATQQVNAGNLSPSTAASIKAKANRVLGEDTRPSHEVCHEKAQKGMAKAMKKCGS